MSGVVGVQGIHLPRLHCSSSSTASRIRSHIHGARTIDSNIAFRSEFKDTQALQPCLPLFQWYLFRVLLQPLVLPSVCEHDRTPKVTINRHRRQTKCRVDVGSTSALNIARIQLPQAQDKPGGKDEHGYGLHHPNKNDLPFARWTFWSIHRQNDE